MWRQAQLLLLSLHSAYCAHVVFGSVGQLQWGNWSQRCQSDGTSSVNPLLGGDASEYIALVGHTVLQPCLSALLPAGPAIVTTDGTELAPNAMEWFARTDLGPIRLPDGSLMSGYELGYFFTGVTADTCTSISTTCSDWSETSDVYNAGYSKDLQGWSSGTGSCNNVGRVVCARLETTTAPTQAPTSAPTATPTGTPTGTPTSSAPTLSPTLSPTSAPTTAPTLSPTLSPTSAPTMAPTLSPTLSPTSAPTTGTPTAPTLSPTLVPTLSPTSAPTTVPTLNPTLTPTLTPTMTPTPALGPCKRSIRKALLDFSGGKDIGEVDTVAPPCVKYTKNTPSNEKDAISDIEVLEKRVSELTPELCQGLCSLALQHAAKECEWYGANPQFTPILEGALEKCGLSVVVSGVAGWGPRLLWTTCSLLALAF